MLDNRDTNPKTSTPFISSLAADAWRGVSGRYSFERWHFDALSDDGREALVLSFYDNYPFSPRYLDRRNDPADQQPLRHPAVTFLYSIDGKTLIEAVNEWDGERFKARTDDVTCSIGNSAFSVEKVRYGSGYMVHLDMMTARRRHIEADLEWLSIESDLIAQLPSAEEAPAVWNLVAPRSDVSGRIVRTGTRGRTKKVFNFRGTGYHDHFQSREPFQASLTSRCWGRAHFADMTAVFQNITYSGDRPDSACIALITAGRITPLVAKFTKQAAEGDNKLPFAEFSTDDNTVLNIRGKKPIQRGFFEQRMLADVELTTTNGETRSTEGIVEYCQPNGMNNPLYRWVTDLKIGRNGGSPFL